MSIQWFPGHMHKARKEIAKVIDQIDVVIEVLDARLPQSSENPLVEQLRGRKPVIKVLNKSDLADAGRTRKWVKYLSEDTVQAMPLRMGQKQELQQLVERCKAAAPARVAADRPVRVMIMGIPNVGKSTLINALMGRKLAKVGNEPAVTKTQQRFVAHNGLAIFDTPGILWPKIEDEDSSYRLAASGAIRDTVVEYEDIALYSLDFLRRDYPQLLKERFKLTELPASADELLDMVGRKRGCLKSGGVVDRTKAGEILIGDLRSGLIGRLSFETVGEWVEKKRLAELERQRLLEQEQLEQQDSSHQSPRNDPPRG
ncbi:ribosome biogenesis GTPase YlqF [Motiliproteus coralliicola]|uniref:Ribosome biogenesis GTPase A n=1 Tax=Motiliproteus coralliicola TaxID=2283196 RepID=A0A369WVB7_9GAMM|nr:ribosome biogenesis GTPase YlqF [Motiliproteus coralliicola]RDE24494.1 ribosome biogenesis GTPase YlqF [Motiliproteus coralliicola]